MTTGRPRMTSRKAAAVAKVLCLAALLLVTALSGCSYLPSKQLPYGTLAIPYDRTQLKKSTTLDVLNVAQDPAYQFSAKKVEAAPVTQSDTVVAYSGRSKDGRITWLNLVTFDEFRMTAKRKYFFCIDERAVRVPDRPKKSLFPPRQGLLFDCEFALDPEILTTPYATDEAQKIALVRWLAGQFRSDVTALTGLAKNPTQGNKYIRTSAMMVRQMFQGILVELDKSPDFAKGLAGEKGVLFPHMSLNEGRVRLVVQNDLAAMKVRVNLPMVAPKP
jgi:hypothetical protein